MIRKPCHVIPPNWHIIRNSGIIYSIGILYGNLCTLDPMIWQILSFVNHGFVDAVRAKKPKRLPTVLTKEEVRRVIGCMSGTHQLMAKLLYGSGLRLMECIRLRVKDSDRLSRDPRSGVIRRHHVDESGLQKAVRSPLD